MLPAPRFFALLAVLSVSACGNSTHAVPDGGTGAGGTAGRGWGGNGCAPMPSGPSGDANAAATWSKPFTSSKWLGTDMWTGLSQTIAVDAAEHVYITDSVNIFQADATGVRVLYAKASLDEDFGATTWGIEEIDVLPDGRLFALVDLSSATFTTSLYAADGSGHLRLFADFKAFWPNKTVIAAISSNAVLAPFDNLYCVSSMGLTTLYGPILAQFPTVTAWDTYGCSGRSVTNELNGSYLYYLPGCNGSPLVGGRTDGSGVSELWSPKGDGGVPSMGFWSLARAPHGGSIVNAGSAVFYVDDRMHLRLNVTPEPSFEQCSHAVGPSNTIYFQCLGDVHRVTPAP